MSSSTNSFIPPFSSSHTHSAALHRPQSPRNALYRPHHPPTRWHLHRVTTVTANLQLPACSHIVWKCSNSFVSWIWTRADVHTRTHFSLDSVYSLTLNITSIWQLPGLNPTQSNSNISVPTILTCPWLTCDIHYEADRVFAHAGAGIQAWILWRGITNLQHLLLYQRAVVGAQRAAIFGPGDGPRCRQRAAQLQHLAWVYWAHRGLRNLVFIRCVCRVNGGGVWGGRGCIRRRRKERWERKKQAIVWETKPPQ